MQSTQERARARFEEMERERAERDAQAERRRTERIKAHTIVGAVVFAVAQLVLGLFTVSGPTLLGPLLMAPCGAVLGFLASRWSWGVGRGTLGGFAVVGVFLAALAFLGGAGPTSIPLIVVSAALSGGVPGCLVGFHVRQDL